MKHPLTIAERVFKIVEEFPHLPAVETLGEAPLTFAELWALASSYSNLVKPVDGRIALCLPKSAEWIAAILGCWIEGHAPVILDPDWPDARQLQIADKAQIQFTVTQIVAPSKSQKRPPPLSPETPAYIIYSSGSTGQPKGVVVPHAGLLSMLDQQIESFRMSHQTRSLWLHGIAFDASISDIGTALLSRATLCIDPLGLRSSGQNFLARVARHQITHIDIPPALLAALDPEDAPACLRSLVIGGSVCPPNHVRKWANKVHLVNVYGPTEATVCTSMIVCTTAWNLPLIGPPIEGISYQIVDSSGSPSSQGELMISGPGVALEYLGQTDLTNHRFFKENKIRTFHSGDLVKKTKEGNLVFLGRIDRQVKLNGKLICPEEIETALLSSAAILQAHVALQQNTLTAWVVTSRSFDLAETRNRIGEFLPSWMIPSQWIQINEFPTLSNGKVDIQNLSHLKQDSKPLDHSIGGQLTLMLREILGLPNFKSTDDFFHNGGDSLAAMKFLARAENLDIELPPDCLYQYRTVEKIVRLRNSSIGYACSSSELSKRVAAIKLPEISVRDSQVKPHVFLTGATGFLGSAVLGKVLSRTDYPVTCLVRGNPRERKKLISEKLNQHGFSRTLPFRALTGDLEKHHLGIGQREWDSLSTTITHIIHCGASTHSLAPYEALAKTNIGGTATVLELQRTGCPKQLMYASTLSVFVDALPLPQTCSEDNLLDTPTTVFGGYAQTKWVAEKLVQANPLPTHILRFGLLTANQSTGYSSHSDSLTRKLLGSEPFPHPGDLPSEASLDFTPIDYAASILVDVLLKNPILRTFHVANPRSLYASEFYRAIEASEFQLKVRKLSEKKSCQHQTSNLFKTTGTTFSTSNTRTIQNFPCPAPSHDHLVQLLNRMHTNLSQ